MAYTDLEGREGLNARLGEAVERLGDALGALGEAYDALDDMTAERMEEKLFGPLQKGYGAGKKAYAGFAARHGLEGRAFATPESQLHSSKAGELIAGAAEAAAAADHALTELQDDPALLEVGDQELRAGVVSVREAITGVPGEAKLMLRTLGR